MPRLQSNQRCRSCDSKNEIRSTKTFGRGRILADGSIQYRKKGWEPPPVPNGYVRDPKDPWHFLPEWPACDQRLRTTLMKKCGALHLLIICNNPEAPTHRQELTVDVCKGCPFKK